MSEYSTTQEAPHTAELPFRLAICSRSPFIRSQSGSEGSPSDGKADVLDFLTRAPHMLRTSGTDRPAEVGDVLVLIKREPDSAKRDDKKGADEVRSALLEPLEIVDSVEDPVVVLGVGIVVEGSSGSSRKERFARVLWLRPRKPLANLQFSHDSLLWRQDISAIVRLVRDSSAPERPRVRIFAQFATAAFEKFIDWCHSETEAAGTLESGKGFLSDAEFQTLYPYRFIADFSSPGGRLEDLFDAIEAGEKDASSGRHDGDPGQLWAVCTVPADPAYLDSDEPLEFSLVSPPEAVSNIELGESSAEGQSTDLVTWLADDGGAFEALGAMPPGSSVICFPIKWGHWTRLAFAGATVDFSELVKIARDRVTKGRCSAEWSHSKACNSWFGSFKEEPTSLQRYELDWSVPRYLHFIHPGPSDSIGAALLDFAQIISRFCVHANRASQTAEKEVCTPDELSTAARTFLLPGELDQGGNGQPMSPVEELDAASSARIKLSRQLLRVGAQSESLAELRDDLLREARPLGRESSSADAYYSWFLEPLDSQQQDLDEASKDLERIIDHGSGNFDLIAARAAVAIPAAQEAFNRRVALIGSAFLAPGLVAAVIGTTQFKVPVTGGMQGFEGLLLVMIASGIFIWGLLGFLDLPLKKLPRSLRKPVEVLRGPSVVRVYLAHKPWVLMSALVVSVAIAIFGISKLGLF